jgi:tetratricopeptide (TPR) repeat protein
VTGKLYTRQPAKPLIYMALRRVLTRGRDGAQVQIVDPVSGHPLTAQMDHPGHVHFAAFSPDEHRLLTLCENELYVWDAATGQLLSPPVRHLQRINIAAFNHDGRYIAAVATGRSAPQYYSDTNVIYQWTLTEDQAPTSALVLYSQVSSRHRIDSAGGFVPLEAEEFQRTWQTLCEQYRQVLISNGRDLLWHQQQARVTRRSSTFAEKFHIDQLIAKSPEESEPYLMRADYFDRLNMNSDAIEDYSKAIELGAADPQTFRRRGEVYMKTGPADRALADFSRALSIGDMEDWHRYAIVAVLAGDREAYRRICSDMLSRFQEMTDSVDSTERWNSLFYLSQSCVLAPHALDDWHPLLAAVQPYVDLGESAGKKSSVGRDSRVMSGAILCRSGQHANALTQLGAVHSSDRFIPEVCLFLCLAHHALGNMDMATEHLREAMQIIEREIHGEKPPRRLSWLLLEIIGREAGKLLEGNSR